MKEGASIEEMRVSRDLKKVKNLARRIPAGKVVQAEGAAVAEALQW